MEAVIFDGKEYVKASVLAEKFRYTSDYLGQLCRAKKVDARLVGRAWYINLDSLNHHKDSRYKVAVQKTPESRSETVEIKKPLNNYLSRIDVEPVLKNKTVKIFRERGGSLAELSVKYEQDEHSLIPRVNKGAVSVNIPIIPADAEKLKVQKGLKEFRVTDFKVEPLPEVFLSGKLHVDGIPEAFEEEVLTQPSSDIANEIKPEQPNPMPSPKRLVTLRSKNLLRQNGLNDIKRVPQIAMVNFEPTQPVETTHALFQPVVPKKLAESHLRKDRDSNASKLPMLEIQKSVVIEEGCEVKTLASSAVESFSPKILQNEKPQSRAAGNSSLLLPTVSFLTATLIALLLVATELEVTINGGLYADRLIIERANIVTFWNVIFP